MERGNIFSAAFRRVYGYFTENWVRKVFFFSLCLMLAAVIIVQITTSTLTSALLIVSAAFAIGVSAVDSFITRREFVLGVQYMEYNHYARIAEEQGEEALHSAPGTFSEGEIAFIKRKRRGFTYSILMKVILIVILVVFLVNKL
jgi:uncharacterized integral membrane protein